MRPPRHNPFGYSIPCFVIHNGSRHSVQASSAFCGSFGVDSLAFGCGSFHRGSTGQLRKVGVAPLLTQGSSSCTPGQQVKEIKLVVRFGNRQLVCLSVFTALLQEALLK